MNFYSLSIF